MYPTINLAQWYSVFQWKGEDIKCIKKCTLYRKWKKYLFSGWFKCLLCFWLCCGFHLEEYMQVCTIPQWGKKIVSELCFLYQGVFHMFYVLLYNFISSNSSTCWVIGYLLSRQEWDKKTDTTYFKCAALLSIKTRKSGKSYLGSVQRWENRPTSLLTNIISLLFNQHKNKVVKKTICHLICLTISWLGLVISWSLTGCLATGPKKYSVYVWIKQARNNMLICEL